MRDDEHNPGRAKFNLFDIVAAISIVATLFYCLGYAAIQIALALTK